VRRLFSRRAVIAGGLLGAGAVALASRWWPWRGGANPGVGAPVLTSYDDLMGCRYTPEDQAPLTAVRLQLLRLPDLPGSWAIWGATGRDTRGRVWVGVSVRDAAQAPSAHLFELDPVSNHIQDRGDVVTELRRCGVLRAGEGQMKIHSRIVQGEDGNLYFASMDEQGEHTDGSRLPTWGSHLWRLRLPEYRWEHLLAAREGLIAVAAAGRWIYALGYFNHQLYQYDCRTGQTQSVAVGALGGHISRNFFCDARGHAYVPRLKEAPGGQRMATTLVELDPEMREVMETPLGFYTQTRDDDSHGLTGVQPMADGSVVFVTDQGYLHRVVPQDDRPADVQMLGWFHPRGRALVESLFTSDGRRQVMALASRNTAGEPPLEWLVHNLTTRTSVATPVALPPWDGPMLQNPTLYGSITRDNQGDCYLGGFGMYQGRSLPLLVRLGRTTRSA
jgi:hypothetical protein